MFDAMRKHLKNYLIPHDGNDHKPHLLREAAVLALSLVIVLLFGFSAFQSVLVRTTDEFVAAVVPAVLVDLANDDREEEGLAPLSVNPVLEEAARLKAKDMAEKEYFAHVSPTGVDPWYWFYRAGYDFVHAGENLAVNFTDSEDVDRAWMDSPGHRANILNGDFTEVGIAAVRGTYKGKKTIYVVQLFGTPIAQAEAVVSQSQELIPQGGETALESPEVAGVSQELVVIPESSDVAGAAIEEQDGLSASVPDAAAAPLPSDAITNVATPWQTFLAQPRAVVRFGYLALGLLIALVLLLMILVQVHKQHPRNIAYGVLLLVLIALLSYFNYLLLAAELTIV